MELIKDSTPSRGWAWCPNEEELPAVVQTHLNKTLNEEQAARRRYATYRALRSMVRDGYAVKTTTVLPLRNDAGDVVATPFTFYKVKPE